MSTERNDAPGGPGVMDDARPDGAASPAPAPAPAQDAAPTPAELDPDLAELAAAQAELAAEETGQGRPAPAAAPPAPAAPAAAAPKPQQPPAAAPPGQPKPPIMVPKARFDEVVRRAQEAEARALMLAGAVEVLTPRPGQQPPTPPPGGAPPAAPAAPNPQQQIEALEADILAAAEKFDAGEMTMAEFKRIEAGHARRIAEAREAELLARVPQPAAPEPGLADVVMQRQHLTQLYAEHPYAFNLDEAQASALANRARADAELAGQPIGSGPLETMRLQRMVAALSNEWGPRWGVQPTAAPSASPPQPQPPATGAGGMSAAAKARMDKLNLAARLPPDTASLGAGAAGDETVSDARIELMSDEEIAALPASVRARILA